jgi:HlyD family secretion protein
MKTIINKILKVFYGLKLPIIAFLGFIFALNSVLFTSENSAKGLLTDPLNSQFNRKIAGIGVVEPVGELVAVSSELSGVVREVDVKVGDQVQAGDRLFVLDQREINAQIKTLQAALEAARIIALDTKAQFEIVAKIIGSGGVAKDDYNRRKYASELAQARVEEVQAQLSQAETTRDRLIVKAPSSGRILEVNIRVGEYAAAALSNPPILMGDLSTLHVRVEFDEENILLINPQNKAEGFFRGDTKRSIPLSFVRVEPYIRPKQNLATTGQRIDTRVLQAIYKLPAESNGHFVGQHMDVFLEQR